MQDSNLDEQLLKGKNKNNKTWSHLKISRCNFHFVFLRQQSVTQKKEIGRPRFYRQIVQIYRKKRKKKSFIL